jgi:hypothetical protein
MPKEIISDRDTKFTSNFWKYPFVGFETKFLFSISYHPQNDEKTERVNQVLEYMLRMHIMHQPKKWEDYLPLVEFSYNNGPYLSPVKYHSLNYIHWMRGYVERDPIFQ